MKISQPFLVMLHIYFSTSTKDHMISEWEMNDDAKINIDIISIVSAKVMHDFWYAYIKVKVIHVAYKYLYITSNLN